MGKSDVMQLITLRFEELINDGVYLLGNMETEETRQRDLDARSNIINFHDYKHCLIEFNKFKTNVISLLYFMNLHGDHISKLIEEVREKEGTISDAERILGIIQGLQKDYSLGFLNRLSTFVEAQVEADFLAQAEQLLEGNIPDHFVHIPTAVLLGAILEDSLRRLCARQTIPISILKQNGEPKTLNTLIDDLKQAGVFTELKAKQLRAWADIRNAAAHGHFEQVTRSDVEQMLTGVNNFLADYL